MDFTLTQDIAAEIGAVDAALVDAAFLARMVELPKLGSVEVLEKTRKARIVHQRVRYLFTAELSGAVRRVVDPDRLTWVEDSTHDLAANTASYRILPDNYANLLEGSYEATSAAVGGATRRVLTGMLRVHVPLVGGKVERTIVAGLGENAEAQAQLLADWVEETG